jgi:hypothetical protein
MTARSPDNIEVLDEHFNISMQDKRTSFPAIVKRYDVQEGKVDIQPVHKFKVIETGKIITPALIQDVPVVFLRTSTSIDIAPIENGDIGQVIISDRSISEWLNGSGTPVYPENPNIMEGSQASFIPGGYPFGMSFSLINDLPENARATIVKAGTGLFLGSEFPLVLNGGTAEVFNMMAAMVNVLIAHDPIAGGGSNLASLAELAAAIQTLKVTL